MARHEQLYRIQILREAYRQDAAEARCPRARWAALGLAGSLASAVRQLGGVA
jgi:hypothetical protein